METLRVQKLTYACKEKDDQMVRLKLMMQRTFFNLMLNLQEVFDNIQAAKAKLGSEVNGFKEDNYENSQQ